MSIRTEDRDGVRTIIIDRPSRRNAIDRPTADALHDAFRAIDEDPAVDAAVLWGAGGHFSSGADLKAAAEGAPNRLEAEGPAPLGCTRLHLSKPVIAAVSGYAVAGGLELAIWCDLRVVEEDAQFGVLCRRWGIPLIDGGTVRLPRLIGQGRALDLVLTGRLVGADEAERIGLATRVVPKGTARSEAEALAQDLRRFPAACLRSDRHSVYEQAGQPIDQAMAREFALGVETLATAGAGGAEAFAQGAGRHGQDREKH